MTLRKLYRHFLDLGGADVEDNVVAASIYSHSIEPYLENHYYKCVCHARS